MKAWLGIVLLAGLALTGCVGGDPIEPADTPAPSEPTSVTHGIAVEDPAGDAREQPAPLLFACWMIGCDETAPAGQGAPVDFPDLVGIEIVGEEADDLVIEVVLSQLDENLEALDRGDGFHRMVQIATCLETDRGELCLDTQGAHAPQGASVTSKFFELDEACNEWQACAYQVPTELSAGEPGTLRLSVPKAYLVGDSNELEVTELSATAQVHTFEPGVPGRHTALTVFQEDDHRHEHAGPISPLFGQVVDRLDPQPVSLQLTSAPLPDQVGATVLEAGPGLNWGAGDPQAHDRYDIRSVAFEEHEQGLSVTFHLGAWDGVPLTDLHIVALFGTAGDEVYEAGVLKEGGEAYGYVGHCITYPCAGPYAPSNLAHNHNGWQETLAFEEQEANLSVTVPWEHLSTIGPGDRLTYMQAVSMHADLAIYFGQYGDDTHGDVHAMGFMDYIEGVLPYTFEHGMGEEHGDHDHGR